MRPDAITFSIVTPTLNRLPMLKEAVDRVRNQAWPRVEHSIVDGGSSDGTRWWVRSQNDLSFVPPPDHGVYGAMNKGIAAATGDLVGLMNSDDIYSNGTLTLPGHFCALPDHCWGQDA